MFETIIQGQGSDRAGRKKTVLVSLAIHVVMLSILIVIPLWYYQTIPVGWEEISKVFAAELPDPVPPSPPPPRPPRPDGVSIPTDRPVIILSPILIEPGKVPPPPGAEVIDIPVGPYRSGLSGPPGPFIPDGVLAGPMAENLRPLAGPRTPPPPPPKPAKQPMLISSLDPSRVIYRVEPVYPPLAIQARVQGAVMLQVTVNEMGIVESVEVVSGHPLLVKAARDAVSQWRYKPTILNGEPVPVKATVTVNFNLHR
ncbi:MAG: energy transducer TonB [Acidobacteria bacterium]|nr:MAG: energy transducer TonB [Acidobacteriota bacterium]